MTHHNTTSPVPATFPPNALGLLLEYGRQSEENKAKTGKNLPRLHEYSRVTYTVHLNENGLVTGITHHSFIKKEKPYTPLLPVLPKSRSNAVPKLISDNLNYITPTFKAEYHAAYRKLLTQFEHIPEIRAVLGALGNLSIEQFLEVNPKMTQGDIVTFEIAGVNIHQIPAVQQAWISLYEENTTQEALCTDSLTGQRVATLSRNFPPVQLPGNSMPAMLQATNAPNTIRYGLSTLGLSQENIETISRALRELLKNPDTSHHPQESGYHLLHWLSGPGPDPWESLITTQQEVHEALTEPEKARGEEGNKTLINLLRVEGFTTRIMLKDPKQIPLSVASENVAWFSRITGGLALWQAEQAIRITSSAQVQKGTLRPHLFPRLYASVFEKKPLDMQIIRVLIQAFLSSNDLNLTPSQWKLLYLAAPEIGLAHKEPRMTNPPLIPELMTPYTLGRYIATAHHLHRRLNATTPTVKDRLTRLALRQPDVAFVEMEKAMLSVLKNIRKPFIRRAFEEELSEVVTQLSLPLPKTLNTTQQAALLLGLHHQEQFYTEQRRKYLEQKNVEEQK